MNKERERDFTKKKLIFFPQNKRQPILIKKKNPSLSSF